MQNKAIPLKICVFLCVCDSVYRSFFSQLVPKQYGDLMEDIVDELGEDEIMEESSKLFFFLRYLDKQ
jgi:hypothetical protein